MKKLYIGMTIFLVIIVILFPMGGLNFLLARTIFAPDFDSSLLEENNAESDITRDIQTDEDKVNNLISAAQLEYEVEVVAENLEIPWEIAHLPDGRILVTERDGQVIIIDEGEVARIHNVVAIGEGGLLGMALSPNFISDNHVFIYYTYREAGRVYNKVKRLTLNGSSLIDEEIIIDRIPGDRFHNGGRIKFGSDEKLYITTGDALEVDLSQDTESLAGKILRINADGSIPDDNPFENSPVYAYGLRNPQGLAWNPLNGKLYSSDHGPTRQDEINLILPGKNYGWPIVTCNDGETEFEDPIVCYPDFTLAPSGMDFLPSEYLLEVPLYVAGLRGNMIMRIDLDREGNVVREEPIFQEWGRIRTVVYHEGSLYIATNNRDGRGRPQENDDKIFRITPNIK